MKALRGGNFLYSAFARKLGIEFKSEIVCQSYVLVCQQLVLVKNIF